jgi:hypothetical protein
MKMNCLSSAATVLLLAALLSCAKDDDGNEDPQIPGDHACFITGNGIVVSDIRGIPAGVTFDRIEADITGADWRVIGVTGVAYVEGKAVIPLPASFPDGDLMKAARTAHTDYTGFWPAAADNADAKVAALGDITAYDGGRRVGRILPAYWTEDSAAGTSFVYYIYADRPFTLSGYNFTYPGRQKSFIYRVSFEKGWNAYAYVRTRDDYISICTTSVPAQTPLAWYFE